jgi:hypothetical protein
MAALGASIGLVCRPILDSMFSTAPGAQMKIVVLAALALTFSSTASLAEQRRPQLARADGHRAAVTIGRDGQDTSQRCSSENPNIEYRDCVNASTRDPNAKVRLG